MIDGLTIRKYRKLKGLTQAQLAALIYCDVQTISRWENNKHAVSPNFRILLIEILEIPTEELNHDRE